MLQRIGKDMRAVENINLYITPAIAIDLVVLNLLGIAPDTLVAPLMLTMLALMTIAILGNRYRLEDGVVPRLALLRAGRGAGTSEGSSRTFRVVGLCTPT
jgi:hypothetical protein